jgi:hypothetical protein
MVSHFEVSGSTAILSVEGPRPTCAQKYTSAAHKYILA